MRWPEDLNKPGASVSDLEQASLDRLEDARVLHATGRAASMAASVYALEIQLKVLICRKLDLATLPRAFEIHDLQGLLILAGLAERLLRQAPKGVQRRWGEILMTFAGRVNDYRYSPESRWSSADAQRLLDHLEAPTDGVLTWLKTQN